MRRFWRRKDVFQKKTDLTRWLFETHCYRSYLEICTPTTGNFYHAVDTSRLTLCHRLMSQCPDDFSDGMPVDFRVSGPDSSDCVREMKARGDRYDVVFVDPWHEYDASYRAILAALDLVAEGGTIVVHDCLPPNKRCANPTYIPGPWCGVTFKAYIDVVLSREDITYETVNIDFGCGVIRKLTRDQYAIGRGWASQPALRFLATLFQRPTPSGPKSNQHRLRAAWDAIGDDFDRAFEFLYENKKSLLNLVSPKQFRRYDRKLAAVRSAGANLPAT